MAMLTAADIQAMIEATVRGVMSGQAQAAPPPQPRDDRGDRVGHLDERHFRRIDKFDGVESKWKEWSFQMKTTIGSINPKTRSLLEDIQKDGKDVEWDLILGGFVDDQVTKMGAKIYNLLVLMVTGEALTVVRGVAGGNGWQA